MLEDKIIIGFETRCDEAAIAIMRNDELLVNQISSQIDLHEKFGGVVPEVASRAHAEMIRNLLLPTLEGFKKTTTPWMLPDGDEVLFKKTKSGVKKALRSQKSASTLYRTLK